MNSTQQPVDAEAMEDDVFTERDPNGIARYPETRTITGLCDQSIRNRTNKRSPYYDETFPKKRPLSNHRNGAVGFVRGELYAWVASRRAEGQP